MRSWCLIECHYVCFIALVVCVRMQEGQEEEEEEGGLGEEHQTAAELAGEIANRLLAMTEALVAAAQHGMQPDGHLPVPPPQVDVPVGETHLVVCICTIRVHGVSVQEEEVLQQLASLTGRVLELAQDSHVTAQLAARLANQLSVGQILRA